MARYIDADELYKKIFPLDLVDKKLYTINAKAVADGIAKTPTADVVPRAEAEATLKQYKDTVKSEIDRLEYTLAGVMWSIDKWLEGDELKQDEVNRAATMREKTLRIVEGLQAEVDELKKNYRKQTEGEWIVDEEGFVTCSNCGEEHTWDEFRPLYCDMCGAKMKGGDG